MPTTDKQKRILAIVVNWNKRDYLENVLRSLRELGGTAFDVVVVDNASTDGSPQMVREKFPEFSLVETGENLGGTGGFNTGMWWGLKHEKGYDYFWLLDNDVVVHPGALDALIETMESDAKIAIVGSMILSLDDPDHVQEVAACYDWRTAAPLRNAEGRARDVPQHQVFEADYAAACSLLARVEAIRKVGTWDPAYFVQMDDIEWGLRFRQAGWRVVGTSDSVVRHENFDNRRVQQGPMLSYMIHRNCLYMIRKICPPELKFQTLHFRFRYALSVADNHRMAGRPHEATALRFAVEDAVAGRMGKPRPEIFALKKESQVRAESGVPGNLRRVAICVVDNSEKSYALIEQVRAKFPEAKVDSLLLDPMNQLLQDEKLPNKRAFSSRSLGNRLRIARTLAADYDALVVPEYVSGYFFFEFARLRLRPDEAMGFMVERRNWGRILGYFPRRIGIWMAATVLAWRMMRKTSSATQSQKHGGDTER